MTSRITYRKALWDIRALYAEIPLVERDASVNWYLHAHNAVRAITARYPQHRLPEEAQFHMVAALSPGCKWEHNLIDYEAVLSGRPAFRPRTYPAQAAKALLILSRANAGRDDWSAVLRGPKERAFAHNLAYPEAERELTLDYHAYSIACNVRWTTKTCPQFRVAERAAIARAYRKVAEENRLKACQLQAITWAWWRKTRPAPRINER
jgi:hypothetical protein